MVFSLIKRLSGSCPTVTVMCELRRPAEEGASKLLLQIQEMPGALPYRNFLALGLRRSATFQSCQALSSKRTTLKYSGSLTYVVKVLKSTRLTTTGLSVVALPVLTKLSAKGIPVAGKVAMTGVISTFTLASTVMLQWLSRPYVHKMTVSMPNEIAESSKGSPALKDREEDVEFEVEQLSLFMFPVHSKFSLADVKPTPNVLHPFQSFEAKGNTYFIEGQAFEHKSLLQKLYGRPLKEHEKKFVTQED